MAFRGRHRSLTALALVFSLGLFGLMLWAGFRFYVAETVRAQLMWGGIAFWAIMSIGFIKVWFWIEMHTNRVLRELNRVELLLVTRPTGR